MKYNVGDAVITDRGLGIIDNILELRDCVTVYETFLISENKTVPLFYINIKEVVEWIF